MAGLLDFRGLVGRSRYAATSAALILLQHAGVATAFAAQGAPTRYDAEFWLLPLRRLSALPDLPPWGAALAFAASLGLAWAVAALSYRRATGAGRGYALAALSLVPGAQLAAVAALALLPPGADAGRAPADPGEREAAHVMQGVLAGVALIVAAVLVSALAFGAYGWGLFVATPFLVGVTTGYLVNRDAPLTLGKTTSLVLLAGALGCAALLALALEGLLCIVLIAPLGAAAAAAGGAIGRGVASAGHRRGRPLFSLALLPLLFAAEAATPPAVALRSDAAIEVDAPPEAVWAVLTGDGPVAAPPGLVGWTGLAYPIGGRLLGRGVGATRIGRFSTGDTTEVVTAWTPGRRLALDVLEQPPAMEEMSPYRRVHAPHVRGYFDTGRTEFTLAALPDGGTRLRVRATHVLRLEPVLYWEPLARWAIAANLRRALADVAVKARSVPRRPTPSGRGS